MRRGGPGWSPLSRLRRRSLLLRDRAEPPATGASKAILTERRVARQECLQHDAAELVAEALLTETLGVSADRLNVEGAFDLLESENSVRDRLRRLLIEEHTGPAVDHRLACTAATERNHRGAGGLSLDGRDAEILLGREYESACTPHQVTQSLRRLPAQQFDVRTGNLPHLCHLRALTHHNELPVRQVLEGL